VTGEALHSPADYCYGEDDRHAYDMKLAATVLSGPLMQLGAAAHEAAAVPAA
jgi:hypothetical protein